MNVNDLQERINNAEDNLVFCGNKHSEILSSNRAEIFDLDTEVIYQKAYESVEALRIFIRSAFNVMKNVLTDNYELHEVKDNLELDLNSLK